MPIVYLDIQKTLPADNKWINIYTCITIVRFSLIGFLGSVEIKFRKYFPEFVCTTEKDLQ